MNELNFLYPHLSDEMVKCATQEVKPNDKLPMLNREIAELQDVLFPVDPTTGTFENPVTKLLDGNLSALERDKIMSQLQAMPASKRHNLSDDDLINMLPSRYNSTLTDMDAVRDFYENNLMVDIDASQQQAPQQDPQNQQTQSQSAE